jgi:hypothetical protein
MLWFKILLLQGFNGAQNARSKLEIYLSIRARMFSEDIMTTGIFLSADEPCS